MLKRSFVSFNILFIVFLADSEAFSASVVVLSANTCIESESIIDFSVSVSLFPNMLLRKSPIESTGCFSTSKKECSPEKASSDGVNKTLGTTDVIITIIAIKNPTIPPIIFCTLPSLAISFTPPITSPAAIRPAPLATLTAVLAASAACFEPLFLFSFSAIIIHFPSIRKTYHSKRLTSEFVVRLNTFYFVGLLDFGLRFGLVLRCGFDIDDCVLFGVAPTSTFDISAVVDFA